MTVVDTGRLLTVTEAADRLGIGRTAAYQRLRRGQLPAQKVAGRWVVDAAVLEPVPDFAPAAPLADGTPQLRWSSVRDCPRKAVYEAAPTPRRERTDREERILWRGKSLGREYVTFLRQRYGADQVLTELAIQWPLGVGHMDIYLRPTRTAIEVLSSAHATDQMVHSKMLQLVGYIEHADPAWLPVDAGALVVLNPSDFEPEVFPLARTSRTYLELVDEMRERVAQVQAWAGHGTLPARVCGKPTDAIGHFCLYAEHCFDGWEKPVLPLVEDPTARELVTDLYQVKRRERETKQNLAIVETERKELEQRLDDLVPVGKHAVGSLEVTRTHVERGPSFDWKKAEAAGAFDPDAFAAFFKPGASYDTWKVDRVSDGPLPARDWGEVPFHGDERDAA